MPVFFSKSVNTPIQTGGLLIIIRLFQYAQLHIGIFPSEDTVTPINLKGLSSNPCRTKPLLAETSPGGIDPSIQLSLYGIRYKTVILKWTHTVWALIPYFANEYLRFHTSPLNTNVPSPVLYILRRGGGVSDGSFGRFRIDFFVLCNTVGIIPNGSSCGF